MCVGAQSKRVLCIVIIHMGKKKTNIKTAADSTKYYRATYSDPGGGDLVQEVFISDTMEHARVYATTVNAYGRQLIQLEEFKQFIDSLL